MRLSGPRSLLAALALFSCLTACSTQQRHAWLTVFFEGVPPLESKPSPAPPATAPATPAGSVTAVAPPLLSTNIDPLLTHKPFRDRKCSSCHAPDRSQTVRGRQREICYGCHTNVLTKVAVQHFPAQKWECLTCHQPHMSPFGKLLSQPQAQLCYECHDSLDTRRFVHDPVRRGLCTSCHTPHQSQNPHLLKLAGDPLCLGCHKQAAMKAASGHADIGGKSCVQCHDPHESDKKGRLK